AVAATLGRADARIADPADLRHLDADTVTPLALPLRVPVLLDPRLRDLSSVVVSSGRDGLELELTPAGLIRATGATLTVGEP
ncbi:YbaK/EbsC family protein, partial [Actinocorallia lasiicapitis]